MFPFKVRFSRTIKTRINPDQIDSLLDISRDILSDGGSYYFSKENNRLKFDNKFFKLTSSWNLMAPIDAGFVEISETKENRTIIRYSITLISVLIISSIIAIIVWISSKDFFGPWIALMAFGGLSILNWVIAVLRHWGLLYTMTDRMMDNVMKDKK